MNKKTERLNGPTGLHRWRCKQGLSTRDAAPMLGVSGQSILAYEEGTATPKVTFTNRLERVSKGPWQVRSSDWGEEKKP